MTFRKVQSGRSMVEMLGVLAVIGVLSVAAIWGYDFAMSKHKANEILAAVFRQLPSISTAMQQEQDPAEYEETLFGVTISLVGEDPSQDLKGTDDGFVIQIENLSSSVCKNLINGFSDEKAVVKSKCDGNETENYVQFTFNYDLSPVDETENFGDIPAVPEDNGSCPEHAICTGDTVTSCEDGYKKVKSLVHCQQDGDCVVEYDYPTEQCITCPAGWYCKDGKASQCPKGNYCPSGSAQPIPCEAGTYMQNTTKEKCLDCEEGYFCPPDENGLYTKWGQVCPQGHYCPSKSAQPTPCPAGTYQNSSGKTQAEDCKPCPDNSPNSCPGSSTCTYKEVTCS